jgi:diguanylate cyclase
MLQGLFINACILVTVIFITSQIFRNAGISLKSPVRLRIRLGFLGGLSAIILIHFSMKITSQTIQDFRDICLILVAIFGGIWSSLITGLITALYRLAYNGVNYASFVSAIGILVVSIGCGVLSQFRIEINTKCKMLLIYSLVIRSIVYCIVLTDTTSMIKAITSSWISTLIIASGVYYLVRYLVEAHRMIKTLKRESSHDFLTGLSNTRQFEKKYNAVVREIIENGENLSLFIIDIDHFKKINDTYGHGAGDVVLKELGKVLRSAGKEVYLVARIGGEEFAVLLKNYSKEKATAIADRIRAAVESQRFILKNNKKINITVSIGAATYPDTVHDINDLREAADRKLYEAKWSGRNKVCI